MILIMIIIIIVIIVIIISISIIVIIIINLPPARPSLLPYQSATVGFHNFKSQNFKLSVSNPKSKHVAYVSVLSQISNCQGLGRKNKHEILKTDRTSLRPLPMALTDGPYHDNSNNNNNNNNNSNNSNN